jgi:hypothetical protein
MVAGFAHHALGALGDSYAVLERSLERLGQGEFKRLGGDGRTVSADALVRPIYYLLAIDMKCVSIDGTEAASILRCRG